MSARETKRHTALLKTYGGRYHRVNGERGPFSWLCPTCSAPADTIEHYPPLSRVSDYEAMGGVIYIRYPCCQSCNSYGAAVLDDTFIDRFERVKDRMARKWSKYLKMCEWDEDELDELGSNLRTAVESGLSKHEEYTQRLEYYLGVDTIITAVHDRYGDGV